MFDEISLRAWLADAIHGPGSFRFLVQPIIAILLGVRDGRQDARRGHIPYIVGLLFETSKRRMRVRTGLKAAALPLALALLLDCTLQFVILGGVDVVVALVVALLLIVAPYISSRALTNRALKRWGGPGRPPAPSVPAAS